MAIRRTEPRTTNSYNRLERPTGPAKADPASTPPPKRDDYDKTPSEGTAKLGGGPTIAPTKIPHPWAAELRESAVRLGSDLHEAGTILHDAGDGLEPTDPLGLEAHAIGTQAHQLGKEVTANAEATQVNAGQVHSDAAKLATRANGLLERAEGEVKRGKSIARKVIDKIGDGARAIGRAVKQYTQGVAHAIDYGKNIDKLGTDDTYKLGVEAFLMIAGAEVEGAGGIEVEKHDDHYSVSLDGELAGGIYAELGVNILGAAVDAHASLTGGFAHRLEVSFDTAAEAKRAVKLMLSRIAKTATLRRFTPEEAELFKKHLSAVELRGHVAGEAFAMMGLKGIVAGLGDLKAKAEHTVRLELGDKPALIMTEAVSASLFGGVGVYPETEGEVMGLISLGQGTTEASVELESRFDLGKNVDLEQLKNDPIKGLKALKKQVHKADAKERATFELEAAGGLLGSGGGFGVELGMAVNIDQLKQSGAIKRALRGDLEGALGKLPPSTLIDGTFEKFANYGVDIGPAVYFMSFGAGFELEAMRKDVDFENIHRTSTPVAEAYQQVSKWVKRAVT